jgi:hypothetical protein
VDFICVLQVKQFEEEQKRRFQEEECKENFAVSFFFSPFVSQFFHHIFYSFSHGF